MSFEFGKIIYFLLCDKNITIKVYYRLKTQTTGYYCLNNGNYETISQIRFHDCLFVLLQTVSQ